MGQKGCWILKDLESDAAKRLMPGVSDKEHFADGVVEADVLQ
jgi:hypothetical protein